MFTEVFFQEHDVHFNAISDGVDGQKGDNELPLSATWSTRSSH